MGEDGIILRDVRVWQPDPDGIGRSGYVTYMYRVLSPLTAYLAKESANRRFTIFFSVTPTEEEECLGWMWLAMNYAHEIPEKTLREFQDLIVSQDIPTVESQRPRRLPLNNEVEFHLPSDRASIAYRKWLKQLGVIYFHKNSKNLFYPECQNVFWLPIFFGIRVKYLCYSQYEIQNPYSENSRKEHWEYFSQKTF